jgi:hypothetical protein
MVKKEISFGQGPRQNVSVNPPAGPIGTVFYFNAAGFDRAAEVQIEIIDSRGLSIYCKMIKTDRDGGIGGLEWKTESRHSTGEYKFIVTGKYRGHVETFSKTFSLFS